MDYQSIFKQIFNLITEADNILLISHYRPDGDTLGAALALAKTFDRLEKKHLHFCLNKPANYFYFLPKIEALVHDQENLDWSQFKLIIILDCGDLKRTGIENKLASLSTGAVIVNIDHHRTNENFGHFNLVDDSASSTSELVYRFLAETDLMIDPEVATSLLTGILTDTSNFTNSATTISALKAAADLLARGARFNQINFSTSKNKSLETLKLWGRVLSRLEETERGVVTALITSEDLESDGLGAESVEGIANFLNNIESARIILVIKEEADGVIKGSLRTNDQAIDVSLIAKLLGGGGHKMAAGFSLRGQLIRSTEGWKIF